VPHDHDRDQPNYYRAGYFPRRFVSLAKEIQRKPKGTPTQKDNEAADDAPLVVETRRLAGVTRQLVIWTCVIAGVGVLAFFASLLQWDAMRGQLGEMRTADINANRAFVVAKGLDAYPVKAADNSVIWNISVIFENSGNSPTERLIVNANPCLSGGSNGLPRDFSFPDFSVEKVPILLGPKNQASLKPIAIDPFMMQTMEKKGGIMQGELRRQDKHSTTYHRVLFCFEWLQRGHDDHQRTNRVQPMLDT
jgi:hypothetical protein